MVARINLFGLSEQLRYCGSCFDGEAPYLQSFIDHHRRLGVDAFYPVLAPGGAPLCREIFARNGIAFHESDGQRISSV